MVFKKGILVSGLMLLTTGLTHASVISPQNPSWIFSGSLGFYKVQDMLKKDGDTFFSRLSAEKIVLEKNNNTFGLEVGIQSGNQARLGMTDTQNNDLGGTSVMTTLKPEFDVLLTMHRALKNNITFGYLKTGAVYRHLTMDRGTINDLRKVNFELQAGITQKISQTVSVSLGYQGMFSSGLDLNTSSVTNTGSIKNIPSQHGLLFSAHYNA